MWSSGHKGPHSFRCEPCDGSGIQLVRANWVSCNHCHGRGWKDERKWKKGEADAEAEG
jgi:DnaJ-class molecular chaperone